MSTMYAQPDFYSVGVTELSFDEVEAVAGGPGPLALIPAAVAAARAAVSAAKAAASACRASNRCMAAVATGAYAADKAVDVAIDELRN